MKRYASILLALLCLALFAACGRGYATLPTAEETTSATETVTETETESDTTEEVLRSTEAEENTTSVIQPSSVTTTATTRSTATSITQRSVAASTTTTRASTSATTTTRKTTTTAKPSTASTTTTTKAPDPVYTQADYNDIIAEVKAYAETKSVVRFVWDTSLTFERAQQGFAGYHGTPNLNQLGSKERTVSALKYHCDLTEENLSGANGGVPSSEVHYNIVWFEYQGDILFALIYG